MGQNVKVIVRLRPLLPFESEPLWLLGNNSLETITTLARSHRTSAERESKELAYRFAFESVVGESISSEQLYKREIRMELMECCKAGRNVSIMAYGQTCSGKTHTILGVKEAPGIIPCVLRDLFVMKQQHDRKCSIKLSYTEIYNEKVTDLLDSKEKNIRVIEASGGGFQLAGTARQSIPTFEDSLKVLERGEKRRQYGQGEHHDRSSRSHTLLSIFVDEWDANLSVHSFVITIVDLAGSQRLTHERQSSQQAAYINKSLFQLTNCIAKLADKAPHVPFRDSKLTKLLETSLSGSGRSFLVCCASPSKNCFPETLSTLRLAERAKKIELKEPIPQIEDTDKERLRARLEKKTSECNALREEISSLQQRILALESQLKKSKQMKQQNMKEKMPVNLLILLDHENFTLFISDHIEDTFSSSKIAQQLKDSFVQQLQSLYESYTKEIAKNCFGDTFEVQIDELCYMNMVLEHQKITQYKIQIIDELLKQQEEKNSQEQSNGSMFYNALLQYQHKLKQNYNYTDQIPSHRSSYRNSDYSSFIKSKEIDNSNCSNEIMPCTLSTGGLNSKAEALGTQILVWGCKKDFRVCKGDSSGLGIVRISNLGKIRAVVCGYHHTLAITQEGCVFGWGKNTERQLINCEKDSISTPTQIKSIKKVQAAAAGWGHSLALTFDGELYSWGYGKDGQLGHGIKQNCICPTMVAHEGRIASIYSGHSHSGFLDMQGDLYAFGFNQDYRLMIGDEKEVLQPRRVSIRDVVAVGMGVTHSAIITSNGNVFAGGTGRNGELGIELNQYVAGWEKLQAVDRKFEEENFEKICPLIQVEGFGRAHRAKEVKCGQNMTIIMSELGEVYSFGKQLSHRLGHSKQKQCKILDGISSIECGSRNGFAVREAENKVYSWGFNMYGQSNPQITGDVATPELIQNLPHRNIIGISSGFFHTALLLE